MTTVTTATTATATKEQQAVERGRELLRKHDLDYFGFRINSRLRRSLGCCAMGSSPEAWAEAVRTGKRRESDNPWAEGGHYSRYPKHKPCVELSRQLVLQGSDEQIYYVTLHEIVHAMGINGIERKYKKSWNEEYLKGNDVTEVGHSKKFQQKMFEISGKNQKDYDSIMEGALKSRYDYKCSACNHELSYDSRIKKSNRSYQFYTCPECNEPLVFVKDNFK